jgi:SAM-dependent methyltransferase
VHGQQGLITSKTILRRLGPCRRASFVAAADHACMRQPSVEKTGRAGGATPVKRLRAVARWLATRGEVPRYEAAYSTLESWFRSRRDPWKFEGDPYTALRFDRILDAVRRVPHESILEIGCAEGHLTYRLCDIGRHVVGVDVSATAVERARIAAPKATIVHGRLEDLTFGQRFDVVVCSEMIYYTSDVPAAIAKLNSLGHFVLVTYTTWERGTLDPIFSELPALCTSSIRYLRLLDASRIVNWRGSRVVLWWSGAANGQRPSTTNAAPHS